MRSFCWRAHLFIRCAAVLLMTIGLLTAAPVTAGAATGATRSVPAGPLTAAGCNARVCINLQGPGSTVNDWETTAWAATSVCTQAEYWANGVLMHQGSTQCVSSGTHLVSDWASTWWPSGTLLCNTWPGIPGEPCETIEG